MKKYFTLAFIAMVVMMSACKKDKVDDKIVGTYTVTSFVDNGVNKTAQYTGYTIAFDNNGGMNMDSGGMMNMCDWSYSNSDYHFNMMGMHGNSLNDLDGDWTMTSYNDTICNFADDSPSRNCMFVLHKK